MLFTAKWDDIVVPIELADGVFKNRLETFLDIEMAPSEGPGDTQPTTTIHRENTGWVLDTPLGARSLIDEDAAVFTLLESLNYEFWMRTKVPVIHAGGFMLDSGAVLYLGGQRAGKSRITFAAWRQGYPILGDDRMVLHLGEHAVQAMPKCLKLRLDSDHVPPDWRCLVLDEHAFTGEIRGERRWILSRRLPHMVSCSSIVPVRTVVALRRVESGPTRFDEVAMTEVLSEMLPTSTVGENTALDVLRFLKRHATRGRIRRLNVAPNEVEAGLALLAEL